MLETIFLLSIVFSSSNGTVGYTYHPMINMETCLESVTKSKVTISNDGDTEGGIAFVCVNSKGSTSRR